MPLVHCASDPSASVTYGRESAVVRLTPGDDFVLINLSLPEGRLRGEPLFVGYGINAPESGWDDYKGVDVRRRLLVAFTNEPGREVDLFGGRALTLHGRWRTKLEEAARRGATGMLIIHTDADAGYSWDVPRTSNESGAFHLADDPALLPLCGWLTEQRSRELVAAAGVPAVWLDGGTDYVDRPPGWGVETRGRYRRAFYHRPCDEPQENWDLSGLAQIGQVTVEILREIARAGAVNWKPGTSFRRASAPASR